MNANIHKFHYKDLYFLLDVNSGTVHVIDKIIYDIMDSFTGNNDAIVISQLADNYKQDDIQEALDELHKLINMGQLFAPKF